MDVLEVLKVAYFARGGSYGDGLPLLFWGLPGPGKTAIIEQFARSLGVHCEVLSPGERGEGAFGCVPVPVGKAKDTRIAYPAPWWLDDFNDRPGSILFVDELSSAPPALHPPLLGLIQAKRIGGSELPRTTRVFAAANPPECAAGGFDLAPPVANRLGHIQWPMPTAEQWADYMIAGASGVQRPIDAAAAAALVESGWDAAFAAASALTSAFARANPGILHRMPTEGSAAKAWPSHRTWELATRALASARLHRASEETSITLVSAFVGDGAASEFLTWAARQDLPDAGELLDGRATFKHDPTRADRTHVITSALAATLISERADKVRFAARAEKMWSIFDTLASDGVDLVYGAARAALLAAKNGHPLAASLTTGTAWIRVMTRIKPALAAAGITP